MFYIVVTATGDKCGPIESKDEAHQKGTMWYGTGNFTIEPVAEKKKPMSKQAVVETPEAPVESAE